MTPAPRASSAGYRPDIDGLRAIAVLAVVLFHAGVPGVAGGYVGVDVFFVISGYLITGILLRELKSDTFSLAAFYERRIRRIFPPFFVVLVACGVVGWFTLLPREFANLGKTAIAATLFYANVEFFQSAGYFAPASETKPLLHTWSLSVEEQFYLVFPLLLAFVYRRKPKFVPHVLALLFLVSLAISEWSVRADQDVAFYLPHSRTWELVTGSLLASGVVPALSRAWQRHVLGLLGLGLIAFAIVAYDALTTFPGVHALVPCLGAAAVIHAGTGGSSASERILSYPLFVKIGLFSYGFYLWHWPVLVFARQLAIRSLLPHETAIALGLALLGAILSYYLVETPIRARRVWGSRKAVFAFGGVGMAALVIGGGVMLQWDGIPARLPTEVVAIDKAGRGTSQSILRRLCNETRPGVMRRCEFGADGQRPDFLVWGDSHAASVLPAVDDAAVQLSRTGLVATFPACPPLIGIANVTNDSRPCTRFVKNTVNILKKEKIDDVILVGRWAFSVEGTRYKTEFGRQRILQDKKTPHGSLATNPDVFRRGLSRTLALLKEQKKRTTLVMSIPEIGFPTASALARILWWGRDFDIRPTRKEFDERQRKAVSIIEELRTRYRFNVIDPATFLCDSDYCAVKRGKKVLYIDDDHLTAHGAKLLAGAFKNVLSRGARVRVD